MTTTTTTTMMNEAAESYSFQKLSIVETFSRLVAIYVNSAYTRLFIKLACLMVIPCTFIGMIIINYVLAGVTTTDEENGDDNPVSFQNWAAICKSTKEAEHCMHTANTSSHKNVLVLLLLL